MSRPRPDRDRAHLHPRARAILAAIDRDVAARGLPFKLHEGYRGQARQDYGKTRGISKVGWLHGRHNFGEAFDLVGSDPDRNPWANSLPWVELGAIYQAHECTWGGDWDSDGDRRDQTFHDLVHGQLNGYTLGELRNGVLADAHCFLEVEWLRWWMGEIEGSRVYAACMQRMVARLGHNPGPVDGLPGPRTQEALANFAVHRGVCIPATRAGLLGEVIREAMLSAIEQEVAA